MWRRRGIGAWLLYPVALLFYVLSALRRFLYRQQVLAVTRVDIPVLVVGNITVGGTGKTPLTLYLAQRLAALGHRPGVVSRGHGSLQGMVREVQVDSDPLIVGDEPVLLKRRSGLPVFVGHHRAEAAQALQQKYPQCDVIICDDGLQHYALARDVEIALLDGRGVMNGLPLPAGPLREPLSRMHCVDAVVLNDMPQISLDHDHQFRMKLVAGEFYLLGDPAIKSTAAGLAGLRLHAVAGIGNPQRFFSLLEAQGLDFCRHAFPDHHRYVAVDLAFHGDTILTTEKDAVKLGGLTGLPIWVLPVEARVEPDLARFVLEKLNGLAPA